MFHTRRMDDGLAAAHPRLVMTLTHVWRWGLVTIADPDALEPPHGEGPVSADGRWVVLHVAAAPDVDADGTEVTVHVEVLDAPLPRTARQVLHEQPLLTPRGVVAIGDPAHPVVVPVHPERTSVRVSARSGDDLERLTEVWVELGPDPYAAG